MSAEDRDEATVASSFYGFLDEMLSLHGEHPWRQVGRCVYCSCGDRVRLYQGTIPAGHPVAPEPPRKPSAADAMRRRWEMD